MLYLANGVRIKKPGVTSHSGIGLNFFVDNLLLGGGGPLHLFIALL